jgi:hypothetical protein
MKRIKPKYPSQRRWVREVPRHPKDNYGRRYRESRNGSLEDIVRNAIREARDDWRTPYWFVEAEDYAWDFPEDQKKYKKQHWTPEDQQSIRQKLEEDDAKYRSTSYARRFQRIRVPSLKRTVREWTNFYRTWPWLAKEVAVGEERFIDGAKLRYIPLFKQILDEEWPEDLKMWTDEQYEELIRKGKIKNYNSEILKRLI